MEKPTTWYCPKRLMRKNGPTKAGVVWAWMSWASTDEWHDRNGIWTANTIQFHVKRDMGVRVSISTIYRVWEEIMRQPALAERSNNRQPLEAAEPANAMP